MKGPSRIGKALSFSFTKVLLCQLLKIVWIFIAYWTIYGKNEDPFVISNNE